MKPIICIDELLGQLVLSETVFEAHWSILSGREKIELLMSRNLPVSARFQALARQDDSDMIRMLAYSPVCIGSLNAEECAAALADKSPLVHAAAWAHKNINEAMAVLSHDGRKIMMGLRRYCSAHDLIEFIKKEVEGDSSAIANACEVLNVYCRNQYLMSDFTDAEKIRDGIDFFVVEQSFQILWKFAASAERDISDVLIWGLPLGNCNIREIPNDLIKDHVAIALACRKYEPLLKRIKAHPEMFDPEVIKCSREKY